MQLDFRFVLFAMTTKQILAHTPVSTFQINLLPIDKECKDRVIHYVVDHLILILLDTKSNILFIRYFSIYRTSQFTGIKIRFSIAVRPPKFRVTND